MCDIRVTQVCGKGDEVTRNRFALRRALLRARVAKGVPKVMNARLARPSRASARKPKNPAERITHDAEGDPTISRR